jgi:hypothetical protein
MATLTTVSTGVRLDVTGSPFRDHLDEILQEASATAITTVDEVADDGPLLVRATHSLVGPLFQEFGVPEPTLTTRDGQLRRAGWPPMGLRRSYEAWAKEAGIEFID